MLTARDYSSSGEYAIVRDVQTDLKIPLSNLCEYEMSKRQEKALRAFISWQMLNHTRCAAAHKYL